MPSLIQTALAIEAIVNVPAFIAFLFFPTQTLGPFLATPLSSLELNGTAIFLIRAFGAFVLALTPQMLLAYPNGKDCVGKRKVVYWTLGTGEAALIPLLLFEAYRDTDAGKAAGTFAGGLTRNFCLSAVANLVPILSWRIFLFLQKPHWFGTTEDVAQKSKKTR